MDFAVQADQRVKLKEKDIVWKCYLKRGKIGTNGERESEKSERFVRQDDDEVDCCSTVIA